MLARLKALRDRPFLVALLLGIAAQILFTVHIDRPQSIMFDEVHYVPAAQALLDLEVPRNAEHPLVGKELIAAGIALFGDNPFGWRLVPSLAGTATVVGAFAFLWLLVGSMRTAVLGAVLLALNQTLFVQARTAMLDVFLGAFLLWALVAMLWAMKARPRQVLWRWLLGSVLLGLAVGVKWAAIPYVAFAGIALLMIRIRDHWPAKGRRFSLAAVLRGKDQPHWSGLATVPALLIMGVVSVAVYFVTFLPDFYFKSVPLTLGTLLPLQRDMYAAQTQVLQPHTYQSQWWSWPLMLRPIWFFYEWDSGAQRGVLLIGNPVIMWGGLVAVLACLWAWFRDKAIRPLTVALLWIASLAIYIVIPKSLGFYYYYHLSGIFLALVLAVAFHHFDRGRGRGREEWFVAAALLAFVFFYPILSGAPLRDAGAFSHWTWFDSWR
jgi:dolichyl-phosphate-mannose--protein O-mannosyl transferase